MFGKNPVVKKDIRDDGMYRVVGGEPFFTIQGEGIYAGVPAVFLRLHGCPLRCFFCDTEFSDPNDPELHVTQVVAKIRNAAPKWCKLLVVTGGEPTRQNLDPLVSAMAGLGWTIQVETAGIIWQECLLDCVIIVSPKTGSIHPKIRENANAFKYVIQDGHQDEDGLPLTNTQIQGGTRQPLAKPRAGAPVYLSPMDEMDERDNLANLKAVAKTAMIHNYIMGVQLHKLVGLP